jgi:hypothetical protein
LSYRRADSTETVTRLYDRLVYAFGTESVFKDVDSLQRGDDFPTVLRDWVSSCDVFLAVMGQKWLTVQDEAGRRRIDSPNDWVRQETLLALERGNNCVVIPTFVDGASMPRREAFPTELVSLADRDAQTLHDDVSNLITSLRVRFGIAPKAGINANIAHRSLVEMITEEKYDAARDIIVALRAQGNVPAHLGLDAIEKKLYAIFAEEQREADYRSLVRNARLVDKGFLTSDDLIAGLEAFWQIHNIPVMYDPENLIRYGKPTNVSHSLPTINNEMLLATSLENNENSTNRNVSLALVYAPEDRKFQAELSEYLVPLVRSEKFENISAFEILPGAKWNEYEASILMEANIILLLVSIDFISSEFIYFKELKEAVNRHRANKARVVPVIIRPCDWSLEIYGTLPSLPKDGQPIVSNRRNNRDDAYVDIVLAISQLAKENWS